MVESWFGELVLANWFGGNSAVILVATRLCEFMVGKWLGGNLTAHRPQCQQTVEFCYILFFMKNIHTPVFAFTPDLPQN